MGNKKKPFGSKSNRGPGRQLVPLDKAAKAKHRRDGRPPRNAASSNRAKQIKIKSGSVGRYGTRLTMAIQRAQMQTHGDKSSVVRGNKFVFEGESEQLLQKLIGEVYGLKLLPVTGHNKAWLVRGGRGTCEPHVDYNPDITEVWSFLCCISTDRPYFMEFSPLKNGGENAFANPRVIKMTSGSWILFPSCAYHRCVADEDNKRTIINCLCHK